MTTDQDPFAIESTATQAAPVPESAPAPGKREKRLLTYSSARQFRNCRRAWKHRAIDRLVARDVDDARLTGTAYHEAQELRAVLQHQRGVDQPRAVAAALLYLDTAQAGWRLDSRARKVRHVARAAFLGHVRRWSGPAPLFGDEADLHDSAFEVVEVEPRTRVALVNPETGASSRTFDTAFIVDKVVRRIADGTEWIHEYKTASGITGDYLDKLWTDDQTRLYCRWRARATGRPVAGAIYDVVEKPKHQQREAYREPDEEWQGRVREKLSESLAKLAEKKGRALNATEEEKERARVTGLKSMQREEVTAETDEEFEARLDAAMDARERYVRVLLPFTAGDLEDAEADLWEVSQQMHDARRRGKYGKNTTQCYTFGRPCDYVPLCRAGTPGDATPDELLVQAFRRRDPAEEMRRLAVEWFDRAFGADGSGLPATATEIAALAPRPESLPDVEADSDDAAPEGW